MRARLGAAAALAAATLLSLTLTACGGGGGARVVDDPPDRREDATTQVDLDQFAADLGAGTELSTTAQLRMQLDSPQSRSIIVGVVDYTTDRVSMSGRLTFDSWRERLGEWRTTRTSAIVVGGVMYLAYQGYYAAFDLDQPDELPPALLDLREVLDPLADFADLGRALTAVTSTGTYDIGGEQLQRYEVVLDPRKAPTLQGLPREAGVDDEVTYELWLDDEFRVRELTTELELGGVAVHLRVRLYAWGEPVLIEAPPTRLVVEPPGETV